MRKMGKNVIRLILFIVIMLIPFSFGKVTFADETEQQVQTGSCGFEAKWRLSKISTDSYKLTIYGEGKMFDYDFDNEPWHDYNDNILEIQIEPGITYIGDKSFCYMNSLYSIEISSTVETIGSYFLSNCEKIEKIIVPNGVKNIGESAFNACTNLKEAELPVSLQSLGNYAFYYDFSLENIIVDEASDYFKSKDGVLFNSNCTSLIRFPENSSITEYVIPQGVTHIEKCAFNNCIKLKSVKFPDSIIYVGNSAFSWCTQLESIEFSGEMDEMDDYCFSVCSSLKNIKWPNKIRRIGDGSFDGAKISNGDLPSGLEEIGQGAFERCIELKSVTIPKSVTSMGSFMFEGCENISVKGFCGENIEYSLAPTGKLEIVGYGKMNYVHFSYLGLKIKSISLDDRITELSQGVFSQTDISDIDLPSSLIEISDSAFSSCSALNYIDIPSSVTKIGNYAFSGCEKLVAVKMPDSITEIPDYCFSKCKSLSNVCLPKAVEKIGINAFENCTSLKNIDLPNSIKIISNNAFYYCENLELSGLPNSLLEIGNSAFAFCESLVNIVVPQYVTKIDDNAFFSCIRLKNVVLPTSVEHIDRFTFKYCSLEEFYIMNPRLELSIDTDYFDSSKTIKLYGYGNSRDYAKNYSNIEYVSLCSMGTHVWDNEYSIDVAPTCLTNGKKSIHCSECDEIKDIQEIVAKGHTAVVDEAVAPTCTETGLTEGSHCIVCNEVLKVQKELPAIGHNWDAGDIIKAATCEGEGEQSYRCTVCGQDKTEIIPATGHVWDENYIVDKVATCTEEGLESIHCQNCEKTKDSKTIAALGHNWDKREIIKAATCEGEGEQTYHCTVCGQDKIETIPATGHVWNENYTVDKAATCTEDGLKSIHCKKCAKTEHVTVIPMKNHTAVDDPMIDATCKATGLTKGIHCSICGQIIVAQKEIEKKAHVYEKTVSKATISKNGLVTVKCRNCGVISSKTVVYRPKTVKISRTSLVYIGRKQTPKITVVGADGKTISSSNYTLRYSTGCTKVGIYKVIIAFKGNYNGSITKIFTIVPKKTKLVSLTPKKGNLIIKWTRQTAQVTGYQIQYATKSNFAGAKTITVTKNTIASKTLTKLTSKKKYYVRIRTYKKVSGRKYVSEWSSSKMSVVK